MENASSSNNSDFEGPRVFVEEENSRDNSKPAPVTAPAPAPAKTEAKPSSENPTFISAAVAALLVLFVLLPQSAVVLLLGVAGGMVLTERYPQQILPRVATARARGSVEIQAVVRKAKEMGQTQKSVSNKISSFSF